MIIVDNSTICKVCKTNYPELGKKMCPTCLGAARQRRNKKKSLGLCVACKQSTEGSSIYCQGCLRKRRQYEKIRGAQRVKNGHCRSCATKESLPDITSCENCWWKQKSNSVFGSTQYIEAIKTLWQSQDGKCALTGETLIMGVNASLDHIIPKSKGGTNEPANLQWVLNSINSGKHDLTQAEFIRLCKLVVAKHQD